MAKKKYNTNEERKEASIKNAKNYYQLHKDDPEFKAKRKAYLNNYFKRIDEEKKKQYKIYVTDYAFYIRSVVTGRFQQKIEKNKKKLEQLREKIHLMEERLKQTQLRFGHLYEKHRNNK